jgi:ceramide glucosyltransferase
MVDLKNPAQWWSHLIYWDQNTRAARPVAFFATAVIRSTPFALLFAIVRLGDTLGLSVLAGAVALRLLTAALVVGWGFRDPEGMRNLGYLVPRDMVSLLSWLLAFTKRTTVWRGTEFILTRDGRLVAREAGS